jgi:hypothetical protein
MERIDADRVGKTAAEIVAAGENGTAYPPEVRDMVREAVEALVGKPAGRRLGNRLRHLRKRVVHGTYIDQAGEDAKRVNRWAVFGAEQFNQWPGAHAPHAGHPAESATLSPDVQHVGHVPAVGVESPVDALGPDQEGF